MQLNELLDKIRREQENYSPSQRQVADYVLANYKQIPFYSITTLSEQIGVSHYTVISFCKSLGYGKFSEFKKELSRFASDLIIYNKLADSQAQPEAGAAHSHAFDRALDEDSHAIQTTLADPANRDNLPRLVEMLDRARYIYVTGGRSSSHFAGLLAGFLRYLGLKVIELTPNNGDYLDRAAMAEPEDLLIAFSFPRYTAQIVKSLTHAHQAGIPTVLITDTGRSPAMPYADVTFRCEMASTSYIQCYAGVLSLISAICRVVSANRKQQASDHMRGLEKHLLDQGVFL